MNQPLDPTETRIIEHGLSTATNCIVCGGPLDPRHSSADCHTSFGTDPDDCFSFHFWSQKYAWHRRGDLVVPTPFDSPPAFKSGANANRNQLALRIGHTHYAVVNAVVPRHSGFMGHGGALMFAEVLEGPHAGTLVAANDWWCQGGIPEGWQIMLPDNARFIDKEEYERLLAIGAAPA